MMVRFVLDKHPRVRWAAINAMGQLETDLGPDLQNQLHAKVLPALVSVMDDTANARVQSHAAAAVNGSLDFRHDFRAFCLASPDCQYEYVLANPRLHGFFLLADCSYPEQDRARAWIRASFGAVHDGGHVAALCTHLEGRARAYAAVFVHTLRYLAARGWDRTNDWAARPTETYVWARFEAVG